MFILKSGPCHANRSCWTFDTRYQVASPPKQLFRDHINSRRHLDDQFKLQGKSAQKLDHPSSPVAADGCCHKLGPESSPKATQGNTRASSTTRLPCQPRQHLLLVHLPSRTSIGILDSTDGFSASKPKSLPDAIYT